MTHKARAYAKVNLHLEVLNKRKDFFHNIFSLNANLDLFDRITFKRLIVFNKKPEDISIDIHPSGGEYADLIASMAPEDNLITKAIKAYLGRIGKSAEITILIEKNIPAGAGLAGGSSDAAAVLKLLNNYIVRSNEALPEYELNSIGAKIGADVPYCIKGGFAFCEGIGEIVQQINGSLKYWVLVAMPGISVNTAKAYGELKRTETLSILKEDVETKKNIFRQGLLERKIDKFKHLLRNDFEIPIFNSYPVLKSIKEKIADYKPEHVFMTGSGSAIIGLFIRKKDALAVCDQLKKNINATVTKFL